MREELSRVHDSNQRRWHAIAYIASLVFAVVAITVGFATGQTEFAIVATIVTGVAVIRNWSRRHPIR